MTTDEMKTIERMSPSDRKLLKMLDRWSRALRRDLAARSHREAHPSRPIDPRWLEQYRMCEEMESVSVNLLAKCRLERSISDEAQASIDANEPIESYLLRTCEG